MEIIDAHVHYTGYIPEESFVEIIRESGASMANLAGVCHSRRISCLPELLRLKHRYPGLFTVYGNLDSMLYYSAGEELGLRQRQYVQRIMEMGCDGVKLLEGKPQLRKMLPIADFDSPCWEPFWDYAQLEGLPLLWHVNDPESFWDRNKVPVWAKSKGWLYDESYVNNEQQYSQVLNVLRRHRELKVIFAHFFFMSAQLQRLDDILDKFPNVMVDLTPGIELFENLSAQSRACQEFFAKHHNRIVYGTDIGGRCVLDGEYKAFNLAENRRRPKIVQAFIAGKREVIGSDGDFLIGRPDFELIGPELDSRQRENILGQNFLRFTGKISKVEPQAVAEECRRLKKQLESLERPDTAGLELAMDYFSRQ